MKRRTIFIIMGIGVILLFLTSFLLVYLNLLTVKQLLLVFILPIVLIALISYIIYFFYNKKTRKILETKAEKKEDAYYIQKLKEYLLQKGIQPKEFKISSRIEGKSGDHIIFCYYKNYWHPYEDGYLIINCENERISEAKTKEELKEALFGIATKPRIYYVRSRKRETPFGTEVEEEEVPAEVIEKEEEKKAEEEQRKI
jgi:ABC-type multidrug transport system fused ATPase/permease subunit